MSGPPLAEGSPIERVFLLGGPDDGSRRCHPWLRSMLPALDWRSQVVVAPVGGSAGWRLWRDAVEAVGDQLDAHRFVSLWLWPVVSLAGAELVDRGWTAQLLRPMRRFHDEAYEEQSESRLLVQPLLVPAPELPGDGVLALAEHFRAHLATPTLLLRRDAEPSVVDAAVDSGMRVMLASGATPGVADQMERLWVHHVVDSALDGIEDDRDRLLEPCRRHLVADLDRGEVFPCLRAWQRELGAAPLADDAAVAPMPDEDLCAECVAEATLAARQDFETNRRRPEGRQLLYRLARELAAIGTHGRAAELAQGAFELADEARDRTASAMLVGLCRLELAELEAADAAFCRAGECGADPGVVAFQRGRVQMAWPDEIEALERFGEAMAVPSLEVELADLHLEMAMAHIRLAEYSEARPHLEPARTPDNRAVISFLAGVCELNQGEPERSLAHFEDALDQGPEPDDLARVLLYAATSLKELARYDEAISYLERALTADPDELAIHNLLGFCLYKLGRHAQAVTVFERAVEIDPNSAIDWANLGSNLRDLGRGDEAISAYRHALALDPGIGFAAEALAKLEKARTIR
jgi:tetratricopeptide (TPR) repeat protein